MHNGRYQPAEADAVTRRRRLFNGSVVGRIVIGTTGVAVHLSHLRRVVPVLSIVCRAAIHMRHRGRSKTAHRNYGAQEQQ